MKKTVILRLGTRQSLLALWQANFVSRLIEKKNKNIKVVLVPMESLGDIDMSPLYEQRSRGVFTKDLEEALLNKQVDFVVHCLKDVPTASINGLSIPCILKRDDSRDLLIIRKNFYDKKLNPPIKEGALVGTSSLRRMEQLKSLRPDLQIADLRGNVPTRLERLLCQNYDAIVLAKAGLDRLSVKEIEDLHFHVLPFLPAPAQGALCIQIRNEDLEFLSPILEKIHDEKTAFGSLQERKLLELLEGGCSIPLSCLSDGDTFSYEYYKGFKIDGVIKNEKFPALSAFAEIVKKLNETKKYSVFISSNDDSELVKFFKRANFTVDNFSFHEEKKLSFEKPKNTGKHIVVTSKKTVKYLPSNLNNKVFIASGFVTAQEIKQRFKNAKIYIPKKEGIEGIKEILNQKNIVDAVHFGNKHAQIIDRVPFIPCYETVIKSSAPNLSAPQLVILTSPKEAKAFHSFYRDDFFSHSILGLGESTREELKKLGVITSQKSENLEELIKECLVFFNINTR